MKESRVPLDSVTMSLVDNLKKFAQVKKTNEVVCNSISLLNWAVKQVLEGKKVASFNPGSREVELFTMPLLDRVESSVPKNEEAPKPVKVVSNH